MSDLQKKLKKADLYQTGAYIDGSFVKASGGDEFVVHNPSNGEGVASVADCNGDDVKKAIAAAKKAFPEWSGLLAEKRRELLFKWADLIEKHAQDLATILTVEQGKPLNESLGEVKASAQTTGWMAEEARRIDGEIPTTLNSDQRYLVIKQPVGVCAAITPWNFPCSMITRKIAPALAAGCTIVLKPSEDTPLIALALVKLADEAGFPKGVINIITTSDAKQAGTILCESNDVQKLSFTGSTAVGKILYKQCGDTVKKLSLELGGNAPFIVFDDADIDRAVDELVVAKFRNAGQTCICSNRIFVQEGVFDQFVEKFTAKMKNIKVGDGLKDETTLGPLINKKGVEKVKELTQDAIEKGAKVILGGSESDKGACFFEPTLLTDVTEDMRFYREEIFGPVAPLYKFKTEDEVVTRANDTNYGLAGYVYSRDLGRSIRMAEKLEYGMIGVNIPVVSNSAIPFGGVKESGIGREGSRWGIEEYVETKYICLAGING